MNNHFCHSFWSKPAFEDIKKLSTIAYLYALSATYLKKLGCSINLYTDKLGKELLSGIPYDNITIIDDIDISPLCFASVKYVALKKEPLGTIHIDGDVFIKSKKCVDRIFNHNCDCIVQSLEDTSWMRDYYNIFGTFLSENLLSNNSRLELKGFDFNTGVIGFFNENLKNEYINNYFNLVNSFSKSELLTVINKLNRIITPDLVFEQGLIYNIAQNYKVKCVLPIDSYNPELRNEFSKEIGYAHLLSDTKYRLTDSIKARLQEKDINLYNTITNNINNLFKEYGKSLY